MRKSKHGISLIVLVITIIVMIILAATVIISLNNTGIISSAGNAVNKTNLKQAQNLAALEWANQYLDGERDTSIIKEKIKIEFISNGLNPDDYNIDVFDGGVEVSLSGDSGNGDDGIIVSSEWSYAYTYNATTKVWSDKISSVDVTENVTGDIVAKLYETNQTTEVKELTVDGETTTIPSGKAYKMVISGSGDLAVINEEATDEANAFGAWFKDMINSSGKPENCISSYVIDIEMSDGITSIGRYVFSSFFNLKNIKISSDVTTLGDNSFMSCMSLTNLELPDAVTSIGERAFYYCDALTLKNDTLPLNLEEIDEEAFAYCTSLKKVILQENFVDSSVNLFNGSALEEITIPVSLTNISLMFYNRSVDLKIINYNGSEEQWNQITGISSLPSTVTINFAK